MTLKTLAILGFVCGLAALTIASGEKDKEEGLKNAIFAGGCFWCMEAPFENLDGVDAVISGYSGGDERNPTYEEVCSGGSGHTEAVLVVYDPAKTSYADLLKLFWESHDPTQGMRQGNDVGTQYRSGIYTLNEAQREAAADSAERFGAALQRAGRGAITTEVLPAGQFFYAEDYHQQYLAKNPGGYCGLGGTGVNL